MTDLRKAAKMALEALEKITRQFTKTPSSLKDSTARVNAHKAIEALRQALADQKLADAFAEDFPNTWGKKKHTAPPSKPWVSLTDEEIWEWFESNTAITRDGALRIARAIEAKLKEKNT